MQLYAFIGLGFFLLISFDLIHHHIHENQYLFPKALESMIEWARKTINCNGFFIESLENDQGIISFYKKNGFKEDISHDKSESLRLLYSSPTNAGEDMILTAGPSISQIESFYCYDAAKNGWNSSWVKKSQNIQKTLLNFSLSNSS